jgi:hypothetical protein
MLDDTGTQFGAAPVHVNPALAGKTILIPAKKVVKYRNLTFHCEACRSWLKGDSILRIDFVYYHFGTRSKQNATSCLSVSSSVEQNH